MRTHLIRLGAFLSTISLPALAMAGPGELGRGVEDPAIWGGSDVELCGWPTTVRVTNGTSLCTGTLIHPQVVVYAAHCGVDNTRVRFGESGVSGRTVTPTQCEVNPSYTAPRNDWAYCVLPDPVDLPITPAVMGCEQSFAPAGSQVAVVGFGNNTGETGSGTKRWGMTTMTDISWTQNIANVGGTGETTICSGDSGGPIFVQYADGSWHALGIASIKFDNTCSSAGGQHSLIAGAIPWIEQRSGMDVTPCHTADGTWDPSPLCQNFLTSGSSGTGNWPDWCGGTVGGGFSSTCGMGFDSEAETNPPSVAITSPFDGEMFDTAPMTIPIDISATDDSGIITLAQIEIDGQLIPDTDTEEPWRFSNVEFPQGNFTIRAYAEDSWGNGGWSEPVSIEVGQVDPTTTGSETTGAETTEGESSASDGSEVGTDTGVDTGVPTTGLDTGLGETGPALDEGGGSTGCACSAQDDAPAGALALFGFGLLGLGRRRRH